MGGTSSGDKKVPLGSRSLLFVALSTTGLDPIRHEIIELAAVRVHPQLLYVEREFVSRVRPQFPERCSIETASVNGFDPQLWDREPDLYDVLKRFSSVAQGSILAGHHIALNRAFLDSGFRRTGLLWPEMDHHVLDTASLAWPLVAVGALTSLALAPLCELLGISNEGARSARRNVARTMEVYRRLMALRMPMPPGAPAQAKGDEDAILAAQAARLAEGRRTYGTWRAHDGRNNAGEALLEVMDALNYCAAELVRLARAKGEA
jgi:DNA polymerase-3 subunit epsilon